MMEILNAHERIALQLSGGRDSMACLYLLRDHLHRMTVYWVNTGDAFPETLEVIEHAKAIASNFVEVAGDALAVRRAFGLPSDIVPVSHTPAGIIGTDRGFLLQNRYDCCYRVMMLPMHQRMVEDGITLIIRGQRNSDDVKGPLRSGESDMGVQYLFPIEDWSSEQVMTYLREQGAPIPRFYEAMETLPDCMGCTAWWSEGRAAYLAAHHSEQHAAYQAGLDAIRGAMAEHIDNFNREVVL